MYVRLVTGVSYSVSDESWHYLSIVVDAISCSLTLYDAEKNIFSSGYSRIICDFSLTSLISIKLGSKEGNGIDVTYYYWQCTFINCDQRAIWTFIKWCNEFLPIKRKQRFAVNLSLQQNFRIKSCIIVM